MAVERGVAHPKPVVLRKRHKSGRALIRVAKSTADILEDPTKLSEWDDEELRRGYRRASDGKFRGRPPRVIPTVCHQELTRRMLKQAQQLFNDNLPAAVEVLMEIIKSKNSDDHAKIKAISMVLDRTMGKTPEKVDVSVQAEEPEWLKVMREATVVGAEYDLPLDVIDVESQEAE